MYQNKIQQYLNKYKGIDVEEFVRVLKSDDLENILHHFEYKIVKNKTVLQTEDKIKIFIENLCSLKIHVIEGIIQLFDIKYSDKGEKPLYMHAVDCSPQIFGFINSYYSPDIEMKYKAAGYAISTNNLENLKKIKGLSDYLMKQLYVYFSKKREIDEKIIIYLKSQLNKNKKPKDTSPEDVLKKSLKNDAVKKIRSHIRKNSLSNRISMRM